MWRHWLDGSDDLCLGDDLHGRQQLLLAVSSRHRTPFAPPSLLIDAESSFILGLGHYHHFLAVDDELGFRKSVRSPEMIQEGVLDM